MQDSELRGSGLTTEGVKLLLYLTEGVKTITEGVEPPQPGGISIPAYNVCVHVYQHSGGLLWH